MKDSIETPIFLHFMKLSQYFVQDCPRKYNFICNSAKIFWKLHFLHILVFEKTRCLLKLLFRATELRQRPSVGIFQEALFTLTSSIYLVGKGVSIIAGYYLFRGFTFLLLKMIMLQFCVFFQIS